jgi:hypothetical protein
MRTPRARMLARGVLLGGGSLDQKLGNCRPSAFLAEATYWENRVMKRV